MSDDVIRMLRYNTGTDKKAFVAFKDYFDAVIFNATIVAYSGSAVADLVSVYKNQYIIDPQTHILQHDILAIMSKNKKTGIYSIKKSVRKYLEQLPEAVLRIMEGENRHLTIKEINDILEDLVCKIYQFETSYVNGFIVEKEYDKYLKYANVGPIPKVVIAPYFMLKKDMGDDTINEYLDLNRKCVEKFIEFSKIQNENYKIAVQIVLDKDVFKDSNFFSKIRKIYDVEGYEYIFLWINDFSTWECSREEKMLFHQFIDTLNSIHKKPLMAYGGYDSILLSHSEIQSRLYGVAQSVGYGESRTITPVGGGLPVNKYYFGPLHSRMRFDEALTILMNTGYFDDSKSNSEHADDYYSNICDCETCKELIQNDIDNFQIYNESVPYIVKARYGEIKRNRPTTEASLVAAFHFLNRKNIEWTEVNSLKLCDLIEKLVENYKIYGTERELNNIKEWCEIFAK